MKTINWKKLTRKDKFERAVKYIRKNYICQNDTLVYYKCKKSCGGQRKSLKTNLLSTSCSRCKVKRANQDQYLMELGELYNMIFHIQVAR